MVPTEAVTGAAMTDMLLRVKGFTAALSLVQTTKES